MAALLFSSRHTLSAKAGFSPESRYPFLSLPAAPHLLAAFLLSFQSASRLLKIVEWYADCRENRQGPVFFNEEEKNLHVTAGNIITHLYYAVAADGRLLILSNFNEDFLPGAGYCHQIHLSCIWHDRGPAQVIRNKFLLCYLLGIFVFVIPYYVMAEPMFLKAWHTNFITECCYRFHEQWPHLTLPRKYVCFRCFCAPWP